MIRRTLAGKLSALDAALGDIMGAFERAGMTDDLIIVYTADNGGLVRAFMPCHARPSRKAYPSVTCQMWAVVPPPRSKHC